MEDTDALAAAAGWDAGLREDEEGALLPGWSAVAVAAATGGFAAKNDASGEIGDAGVEGAEGADWALPPLLAEAAAEPAAADDKEEAFPLGLSTPMTARESPAQAVVSTSPCGGGARVAWVTDRGRLRSRQGNMYMLIRGTGSVSNVFFVTHRAREAGCRVCCIAETMTASASRTRPASSMQ